MNKVTLIGALGADPEIRSLKDGRPVANLRLGTMESWRDKQTGEKRDRTEWHRVVIFDRPLVAVAEGLRNGSRVHVEGTLKTRKWTDKDGGDRFTTEVVLNSNGGVLKVLDGAPGPTMSRY